MSNAANVAMTDQVRTMAGDWIAARTVEEIHAFGQWLEAQDFANAPPSWQQTPEEWREIVWLFAIIGILSVTQERREANAQGG